MHVKLINFSPNPEKISGIAAVLTHSKTKPEELEDMRSNYEITQMCLETKYKALTGRYYKIRGMYENQK